MEIKEKLSIEEIGKVVKSLKPVGEYYDGVYYDIHQVDYNGFWLRLRPEQEDSTTKVKIEPNKDTPELISIPWQRAVLLLSNPFHKVDYFQDEMGHHYQCIIYDGIWIDIWADTVDKLMNIISDMIYPDEDDVDSIIKDLDSKEKTLVKIE